MKRTIISALILTASLGMAQAQSPFDGVYYGFFLGAGRGEVTNFDSTGSLQVTGGHAGALVGWNGSNGNIVYGIEADMSGGVVNGSDACSNSSWTCNADIRGLVTVRGRLGIETGSTLIYATAGGAGGMVELETVENSSGTAYPDSVFSTGWAAGLGFEGPMGAGGWNYRIEGLYVDLGSAEYSTDVPYTADTTATFIRFGMTKHF